MPVDQTKEVRVHERPAFYARGAWDKDDHWHPESDSAILSWEENGITDILQSSGLDLSEQDLIRIAESSAPVAVTTPAR